MRHKHFLAALFLLLFATNYTHAQQKGSVDISLGYGFVSSNEIGVAIFNFQASLWSWIAGSVVDREGYAISNYKDRGPLGLSLKLTPSDRLTIGGYLSYERITADFTLFEGISGNWWYNFVTTAIEMDYRYVSKEKFQMYFTLGAGATFLGDTYYPNFQVNALGFRFGKTAAVFAEFGLGYKGIVNVGLSFQPKLK